MRIEWSKRAQANMRSIANHISLDGPRAARDVYQTVDRRVARLADFPLKGRKGRLPGTRELVITGLPYVVIYRVSSEVIIVLRILLGAQSWPPG